MPRTEEISYKYNTTESVIMQVFFAKKIKSEYLNKNDELTEYSDNFDNCLNIPVELELSDNSVKNGKLSDNSKMSS